MTLTAQYAASSTAITPLGEQQSYALGQALRSLYLDPASPSAIATLAADSALFSACSTLTPKLKSQINRDIRRGRTRAARAG